MASLSSRGVRSLALLPFVAPRLLVLVYGFLTAVAEDTEGGVDGEAWPGTVFVGAVMLVIVVLLMCQSWIRSKLCPTKVLAYGVLHAK